MTCSHGWNIGKAPEGYYYYYNTETQGKCDTSAINKRLRKKNNKTDIKPVYIIGAT